MFLFNLLFLAVNIGVVAALLVAATRVAHHLRNNPAGMEALVEHLFVPVFRPHTDGDEATAPPGWDSADGGQTAPENAEAPRRRKA